MTFKQTDMSDPRIMPQITQTIQDIQFQHTEQTDKYICKVLMDMNIDKDILLNQTKEIHRLNGIIAEYQTLEKELEQWKRDAIEANARLGEIRILLGGEKVDKM